ncbi:MFS transporter [Streptomyces decoyicus]|uniref:MFS transporter n=1 Tax=Streptomyces decoyicus TaxID=249567 RepID=UPI0036500147
MTNHKTAARCRGWWGAEWATRSFRAYWAGEASSLAGSSLHSVALPVIAVVELQATPGQISLLTAAALIPGFALALPAGALGDRYAKRPLMVATDLAAAAVVAAVPTCWILGALSMPLLYAVALLLGALGVLHDAASVAIVPELVPHAHLPHANAQMTAVYNIADTSGAYGGSLVVGLAGAVRTLWLDVVSYLISAWCASRIRHTSGPKPVVVQHPSMLLAIREGIRFVMRHPEQRPLLLALAVHAFAERIIVTYAAYTLLIRLHAGSAGLGVVMGAAGVGGLVGALAAPRLLRRFGPFPVMWRGFFGYVVCGVPLLIALPGPVWLGVLAAAGAVRRAAAAAAGSTQRALRQQLCPLDLQSRAEQTCVWLVSGARFCAALSAGGIAAAFGVWAALLAGTVLHLVPVALLWASPVRRRTTMPGAPAELLTNPAVFQQSTPQEEARRVP